MQTTYSSERFGIRVTFPDDWIAKELSPDMIALIPQEMAEQDPRTVPVSVLLRRTPLGERQSFENAVRSLMRPRTGGDHFELLPARETSMEGALETEWTDGILHLMSVFISQPHAFVEVVFGIDPSNSSVTVARLCKLVRVERLGTQRGA